MDNTDYEFSLAARRSETRDLVHSWTHTPAVLVDRHLDVLVSNPIARALSASFVESTNLAQFTFLHPDVRRDAECWDETTTQVAALLRDSLDQHEEDRAFLAIVGELSAKSWDFPGAWAQRGRAKPTGTATFFDTGVGDIRLGYHLTRVPENFDDTLILFGPVDDESGTLLERLASTLGQQGSVGP